MKTSKMMPNCYNDKNTHNWDTLKPNTQAIVREVMEAVADNRSGPECYKSNEEAFEEIEYRSRDGFSAYDHNRGGLMYRNFTDIMSYEYSGHLPVHKLAANEIERQIEYNRELVRDACYDDNEALCLKLGITKEDLSYGAIDEYLEQSELLDIETKAEVKELLNSFEELESRYLHNSESSVMHELRFMYHGLNESGSHTASVLAAINTEGPYHRSHISWAPNVFCEGAKEVEITWRTHSELKVKLTKAFNKVAKEIF